MQNDDESTLRTQVTTGQEHTAPCGQSLQQGPVVQQAGVPTGRGWANHRAWKRVEISVPVLQKWRR